MGNVSIAKLFLAGIIPGLVVGIMIMAISYIMSLKKGVGGTIETNSNLLRSGLSALPSLTLVTVVLGG